MPTYSWIRWGGALWRKFRQATGTGYEHQYEGVSAVMAEDFDLKYVGIVAAIIGAAVLSIGLVGLMLYLI
jgi:hypothetical protein